MTERRERPEGRCPDTTKNKIAHISVAAMMKRIIITAKRNESKN